MPEHLDPSLRHPYYMRLHSRGEILNLGHKNDMSEHSEVPLHSSQDSVSLSDWGPPATSGAHTVVSPA